MDTPSRRTDVEQVNHSGNLPENLRENPIREFDKTPLNVAVEQDLIKTPDTAEPLTGSERKKSKKNLFIALGTSAAGLALAAGAVFGFNAANQAPEEEQRPVATAPGEPTAEPIPENTTQPEMDAPTVAELEIPAGLDSETLGNTIIDRWSEWMNSSASDDLRIDSYNAGESWEVFLPKVAEENKELFTEALYIDTWKDNPNLVENIENTTTANANILSLYTMTAWNGDAQPENIEGFRSWMSVDQVSEQSSDGTTRTILVAYSNHTNSDLNKGPEPSKAQGVWSITTQVIDGSEKIVDAKVIQ